MKKQYEETLMGRCKKMTLVVDFRVFLATLFHIFYFFYFFWQYNSIILNEFVSWGSISQLNGQWIAEYPQEVCHRNKLIPFLQCYSF